MTGPDSATPSATPALDIATIRDRAMAASPQAGAVGIYAPDLDPVEIFREHLALGEGPCYLVWLPGHPRTAGEYPRPEHAVLSAITGNGPTSKANAELFATARADILALCHEVERLKIELDVARGWDENGALPRV